MKIGFPNNPQHKLDKEIIWIGKNGFDYVDLFLEEGASSPEKIDAKTIKTLLEEYTLSATGHIPWYLPIGSPIKSIREAAVSETIRYFEVFSRAGASKTAIHAHWCGGSFSVKDMISFQTESLSRITKLAYDFGIQIAFELTDTKHDSVQNIKSILDSVTSLGFLLDIGHANLHGRKPQDYIKELSAYLIHVHMHDNFRDLDLHLPIGCGNINWEETIKLLKNHYNDTITLEVFSRNKDYVILSKEKIKNWWKD